MTDRKEWAVTAAQHVLEAARAVEPHLGDSSAEVLMDELEEAYEKALCAIGTIRRGLRVRVMEMTLKGGWSLMDALAWAGA